MAWIKKGDNFLQDVSSTPMLNFRGVLQRRCHDVLDHRRLFVKKKLSNLFESYEQSEYEHNEAV